MKVVKMILGCAIAACLLTVAAASALAAPSWYEKSGSGEWEKIGKAVEEISEGELETEDSKPPTGATRIRWKCFFTGTVGPNNLDKIETFICSGGKVVKGTCGSPKFEAVHLPWNTELVEEVSGEIRDKIKSSGAGLPGFTVTCTVIIKVKDTCEGEMSAGVVNNLAAGIVELKFDTKSGKLTCTQSKGLTGSIEGTFVVKTKSGAALSVKR